jgi:ketopantoate reductase
MEASAWYVSTVLPTRAQRLIFDAVVSKVPNVNKDNLPPFDYIVCSTKNIPDVPPTLVDIISPAVTPGHTVVVLIQNGLNIEKPLFAAFPNNIVLSGVSRITSQEPRLGFIQHDDDDQLIISAFENPELDPDAQVAAAKDFVRIYSAAGKTKCYHDPNVGFERWKKLLYNACKSCESLLLMASALASG